ncbi:MAG: hypothetical protein FWF34_02345 [Alphaproteobacteria bacterium]|nr:hypothetical protein [Alphaproteobacteria bacterium]MCL2890070.1 hypothetical protein [Alphaproteobacteria bacterium]
MKKEANQNLRAPISLCLRQESICQGPKCNEGNNIGSCLNLWIATGNDAKFYRKITEIQKRDAGKVSSMSRYMTNGVISEFFKGARFGMVK